MMKQRLTARQMAIMQALWDRGEATVASVQEALASTRQPLAYTTIATLLARLEHRGLVKHRAEGRTFVYQAAISQERVSSSLLGELLGGFFNGRPSELVSYLLEHEEIDDSELLRIKALLAAHESSGQRQKSHKK
jgi:predicted transcriptional regulator